MRLTSICISRRNANILHRYESADVLQTCVILICAVVLKKPLSRLIIHTSVHTFSHSSVTIQGYLMDVVILSSQYRAETRWNLKSPDSPCYCKAHSIWWGLWFAEGGLAEIFGYLMILISNQGSLITDLNNDHTEISQQQHNNQPGLNQIRSLWDCNLLKMF